jgi:hypothetical protein
MTLRVPLQPRIAFALAHAATAWIIAQTVTFYAFVVRARLALGRWPSPYRPDPATLGFGMHQDVVFYGAFGVILLPPMLVILLAAAKKLGSPRKDLIVAAVIFAVSYCAWWALIFLNPGGFGEWFMD